ncbi:hypothetical protein ABT288_40880 [Streptomyces sp. NPDC001093]|uniref:hypothetical protein n=1 Tax=Streptomyces sp. NPDC001093 TaxID=3154376 RepID=UPI00332A62BA
MLLLAVPAGGALWYRDAHDEAVEQALLDRLDKADHLVATSGRRSFTSAESGYRSALEVYRDLAEHHSGSRVARRLPGSLRTYCTTVGAAYGHQEYCDAIEPLKYPRTVPGAMPEGRLGSPARRPDDRLATSLYECGAQGLTTGGTDWDARFGDLLNTFPRSAAATKVPPAVEAAVHRAEKAVGGSQPCTAVAQLRDLDTRIGGLSRSSGDADGTLARAAERAGRSGAAGEYACGADQYMDGDFEVAQTLPKAGEKLPTTASGGSISVTVKNDSPYDITVLYTGPVTGSFTLRSCGDCKAYTLADTVMTGFRPCSDSGRHYPQRTISLPAGTTYFVHEPNGSSTATPASDTAELRPATSTRSAPTRPRRSGPASDRRPGHAGTITSSPRLPGTSRRRTKGPAAGPAPQPAAFSTRMRTWSSSRRRLPSRALNTASSPGS